MRNHTVWRCPTLAYGPGDADLDHTPREHILISEYQRAIEILADVLLVRIIFFLFSQPGS